MAPVMQNDPAIPLTTAAYPRGTALDLPHAKAFNIPVAVPVYPSSSPTVFNVTYDNVNTSGPTGFSLRLAQELWQRGYGVNGSEYVPGMYGGFLFMGSKQANLFGYNIAVNTTSVHAAIVYKAMADAAIYRSFTGKSLAVLDAPLPVTSSEKTTFSIVIAFSTAIFIVMAFAQYSAAIVPGLVHEKHPLHNAKHQQLVSGVSLTGFWLANYFVDLLLYAIPASASILLLVVFDVQQLTGSESSAPHSFSAVILAFVLFGFAIVPFCYLLSHLFTDPPSSQSASVFINMLLGLGLIITSLVLDQIPSTQELNGTLKYFYRLSPLFNLGNALYTLSMQAILNGFLSFLPNDDAFSLNVVGWDLIYLSINAVVYLILAIAIDYALTFPSIKSWFTRRSLPNASTSQEEQDSDVSAEARRVASGATTSDAVVLNALRKVYPDGTVGVESVSLALKSVDAMVQKFFGDMKSTLNSSELREAFERLGCPSRMDYVSKTHPTGFVLADALEDKDGVVTVNDICTWWLGEDRYESMVAHLENVFGQVQLIERQNDVSRFQLTSVDKLALSTVFSTVEQAKASLGLQEYTISQTTLEQIFNTFAAQQKRIDTSS
ncbi:unnamed protein product [Aphanomyces euteiches]